MPNESTIVEGDNYKVKLVRRGPGDVVFLLEIDGKVCELPFDNLVKANTRLDPDHASFAEKQIVALRREAAEAKGRVIDMEILEMRVRSAERAVEQAERDRRAALSELRHLRETLGPRTQQMDPDKPLLVQTELRPEHFELLLYAARRDGLDTETLARMVLSNWLDSWRKVHPCSYEFEDSARKSPGDIEHLANCPLHHGKGQA